MTYPPGRGLCYVRPVPLEDGGGLDCLCDCGLTTILHIELDAPLTESREVAYTCDGCGTAHWLTLYPLGQQP